MNAKTNSPLQSGLVAARLPAQDLDRARRFYSEKLGLEPAEERPGGLLYKTASGEFGVFSSTGKSTGDHSQMGFQVDDIEGDRRVPQGPRPRVRLLRRLRSRRCRPGGRDLHDRGQLPEQGHRGAGGLLPRLRGQPARDRPADRLSAGAYSTPSISSRSAATCALSALRPRVVSDSHVVRRPWCVPLRRFT